MSHLVNVLIFLCIAVCLKAQNKVDWVISLDSQSYDLIVPPIINNHLRIKLDGKYGLINLDNKIVIPTKYEYLEVVNSSLVYVEKENKRGVVDFNDNVIYKFRETPRWRPLKSDSFMSNIFWYIEDNKQVFLNQEGIIFDECFSLNFIGNLFECTCLKGDSHYYTYHDTLYTVIGESVLPKSLSVKDDIIIKQKGRKYTLLNKYDYSTNSNLNFDSLIYLREREDKGLLKFKQNDRWGLVDLEGNICKEAIYISIASYGNYSITGIREDKSMDLLNNKCAIVANSSEYVFDYEAKFSDSLVWLKSIETRGYGLVNLNTNQTITEFIYDSKHYFDNDLCFVRLGEKCGLINKQGEIVIPLDFDYEKSKIRNYRHYNRKYFVLSNENKSIIVDQSGKIIHTEKQYRLKLFQASDAANDLVRFYNKTDNSRYGAMSFGGKVMLPLDEYSKIEYNKKIDCYKYTKPSGTGAFFVKSGKKVPPIYEDIYLAEHLIDFYDDYFFTRKNKKYTLIYDYHGNQIVGAGYSNFSRLGDSKSLVSGYVFVDLSDSASVRERLLEGYPKIDMDVLKHFNFFITEFEHTDNIELIKENGNPFNLNNACQDIYLSLKTKTVFLKKKDLWTLYDNKLVPLIENKFEYIEPLEYIQDSEKHFTIFAAEQDGKIGVLKVLPN